MQYLTLITATSLIRRHEVNTIFHGKSGPVIGAVVLDSPTKKQKWETC